MYGRKILFTILSFFSLTPAYCGELVDIGNNRKMYMECTGTGAPIVILIAGYRDRADAAWTTTPVFSEISKFTRVCMYDRPGTIFPKEDHFEKSRSDPSPQPFTAKDAVYDLRALLTASKTEGPYVIVGHSFGGLIARLYGAMHPQNICGLVIIDGTTEDLRNRWTPEEWEVFINPPKNEELAVYKDLETVDMEKSFQQMHDVSMVDLWKIPTTILTVDQIPDAKKLIEQGLWPSTMTQEKAEHIVKAVIESQENLARLFTPPAKQIKNTKSGHYIQKDNPQLVIDAIRERVNGGGCKNAAEAR